MTLDYLFAPDRIDLPEFTIRSYEPGDGKLLNEATQSSYEHLRTFMPWATPDLPVEESEKLCRKFRGQYLLAENFVIGVFAPDNKQVLGGTGFHLREGNLSTLNAEIGMWIRGDAAGQGLGTKVLVAMLRWGFTEWPWLRLSWRCDTRNLASAWVAEKAGMLKEGLFRSDTPVDDGRRDTLLFAALRDEWLASHTT